MCKKLLFFLLSIVMVISFAGCNNKSPVDSISSIVTVTDSVSSVITQSPVTEQETSSNEASAKGTFDFDEALKNISLFGKDISLPCTFGELGGNYTLGTSYSFILDDDGVLKGDTLFLLYYKGEQIGDIILDDCMPDDEKSEKKIAVLHVSRRRVDNIDIPGIYTKGIGFDSTRNDIKDTFGVPSEENEMRLDYNGASENQFIRFKFSGKNKDTPDYIEIMIND